MGQCGPRLAGRRDLGTLRNSISSGGLEGRRGQLVAGLHRLWLSGEVRGYGVALEGSSGWKPLWCHRSAAMVA